ncbi:MAG: TetR/AcrR family transcriptional regulator, partial [Rhodoglobus sp.]
DNTSRAAAMTETRTAILRAAFDLTAERLGPEIVLADVATRAGTTVKTVLRHFGSREALFDAVIDFATGEIADERSAPVGDIDAAIAAVHAHYERRADWVLRMLGQEHSDTRISDIVESGRRVHREWVQATFAPQLAAIGADWRAASVDLLVVATDIYTWKILRRDIGLTAAETAGRVRVLVTAVLLDTLERN